MLDLKYQQSELDFCAKTPKPGWSNCVLFCQLSMYGEGYCMWGIFSLIFGENDHQMVKFLQKKKYFQKHNAKKKKYSDHNFTCASIVKKRQKSKTKTWKEKKKQETVLVRSPTNFSEDDVQLLIPEIVVHTVHEYK